MLDRICDLIMVATSLHFFDVKMFNVRQSSDSPVTYPTQVELTWAHAGPALNYHLFIILLLFIIYHLSFLHCYDCIDTFEKLLTMFHLSYSSTALAALVFSISFRQQEVKRRGLSVKIHEVVANDNLSFSHLKYLSNKSIPCLVLDAPHWAIRGVGDWILDQSRCDGKKE